MRFNSVRSVKINIYVPGLQNQMCFGNYLNKNMFFTINTNRKGKNLEAHKTQNCKKRLTLTHTKSPIKDVLSTYSTQFHVSVSWSRSASSDTWVGETGAKCYTGQSVTFTYHFVNPLDIKYMPVLFYILLYFFQKNIWRYFRYIICIGFEYTWQIMQNV